MYSSSAPLYDIDMYNDGIDDGGGGRPLKRQRAWQTPDEIHHSIHDLPESSTSRIGRIDAPPLPTTPSGPSRGQEGKERGRLLSCKECRRLKLKCDRVFPCQSCRKRGCADICPEGALTSGRGSRFILANTAELHDRISQLADRVRQLEEGLQAMHIERGRAHEIHPLLTADLLRIKNAPPHSSHLHPDTPTANNRDDVLQVSVDNMSLGPNARPQGLPTNYSMEEPNIIPYGAMAQAPDINIPSDIMHFSVAFPFPWTVDVGVRKRIRDCLPPQQEALELCEQACRNALWQYNLNPSDSFLTNLLYHCYSLPIEDVSPRRLALLLMILSIGSHVDLKRPIGANVLHGEAYHHLARAAVCEIPLMDEPDFDEVHALFFMVWYHLVFSDNKKAVGYAWNLLGFVVKLAQGLGLHRDGGRKMLPEEDHRRRAIFWELLNLDCRLSLSLGRPPSISLAHVDAKRPDYESQGMSVAREEILYHKWKNGFYLDCLSPVLECMTSIPPLSYDRVIFLDDAVRCYPVPPLLDEHFTTGVTTRLLAMQRAFVSTSQQIALLQLHRRCFTDAMNSSAELFRFDHKYAPSVVATYLSASTLISTVETVYDKEPDLSARFLCFWFNAFSAAVTLSLLVSRAPQSPLATFALKDLDRVRDLFVRVAKILPFCGKALPLLEKVASKSRNLHMQVRKSAENDGMGDNVMQQDRTDVQKGLPMSFKDAHSSICQYAEQILATPSIPDSTSRVYVSHLQTAVHNESEMWLPEVYHFASAGVGPAERYHDFKVASPAPTPFSPMEPRVGKHETVNLDHGMITVDLTDTSYMAWF